MVNSQTERVMAKTTKVGEMYENCCAAILVLPQYQSHTPEQRANTKHKKKGRARGGKEAKETRKQTKIRKQSTHTSCRLKFVVGKSKRMNMTHIHTYSSEHNNANASLNSSEIVFFRTGLPVYSIRLVSFHCTSFQLFLLVLYL